jgi:hypothetical protein
MAVKSNRPLRALLAVSLAGCSALAFGCQSKYGGRHYDVRVATSPPGATLYVIEYDQFLKAGGEEAFKEEKRPWSDCRIDDRSPTTISKEALLYVCIGTLKESDGKLRGWTRTPFTPGKDKSVSFTLEPMP